MNLSRLVRSSLLVLAAGWVGPSAVAAQTPQPEASATSAAPARAPRAAREPREGTATPSPTPAVSPSPGVAPVASVSAVGARASVAPMPAATPAPRTPRAVRAPRLSGGYLGVELVDLTPELREHFGAPREVGVMVGRVEAGSPAARAGVEVGDVITAVAGEAVHDSWGLSGEIGARDGGDVLPLTLVRDGREKTVTPTIERREREAVDVGRWIFPPTPPAPMAPMTPMPPPAALAPPAPGVLPVPPTPPVGPALERLGRLLESDQFQEKFRAAQLRVDGEVEKRMHELELRLKELERRLQEADRRR